jgi:hypothetical protein
MIGLVLRMPAGDGGAEVSPDAPISGSLLEHALGMELQPHQKIFRRIEIRFNESVFRVRHWREAARECANSLMMVAVYAQTCAAIPALQRSAGNDRDGMAIGVVMLVVDMLQGLLHGALRRVLRARRRIAR